MDIPMEGIPPATRSRRSGGARSTDASGGERPLPRGIEKFPVMFDGLAGTYFRIWLVNLLLTIVTLGLYVPFARRRTAQFFYGHTLLADSPLEFTAKSRRMFVGYVLMGLLFLAYQIAAETGQGFMVAFFIIGAAGLAPWFWGSAMRFRLASTRWRGIRLQFQAGWGEVYRASWPVFAIAATWLVAGTGAWSQLRGWQSGPGRAAPEVPAGLWLLALFGLLTLVMTVLCIVRLEFNYKRLLFTRGHVGDQPGVFKPVYSDFVRVWSSTLGFFIAGLLVAGALALAAWAGLVSPNLRGSGIAGVVIAAVLFGATLGAVSMLALLPALAFREARMFRLVWNNVGVSNVARFRCDLSAGAYVLLRVRNTLLTLLTLGFYRPFARISEYRMKAESVEVLVKGGVDRFVGRIAAQQGSLGDAMADAAGLDLIG